MSANFSEYQLFPIKDNVSWKYYKTQEARFWSVSEIDFIRDAASYAKLEPKKQSLIDHIFGFFGIADGQILDNLLLNFVQESKTPEEKAMLVMQMAQEQIHIETYQLTILTFHPTSESQERIFSLWKDVPCIKKQFLWMKKYMEEKHHMAVRRAAFAAAESILFPNCFAIIYWFRTQGEFANLVFTNHLISYDENQHGNIGAYLYHRDLALLEKEQPEQVPVVKELVAQLVDEIEEIALEFMAVVVPEKIEDLDPEALAMWSRRISDNTRAKLGIAKKHQISNEAMKSKLKWSEAMDETLSWMNEIYTEQKANQFEVRISNYRKFDLEKALNWKVRSGLEKESGPDPVKEYDKVEF